jgi:alpha-1,2-mannosyltransferase
VWKGSRGRRVWNAVAAVVAFGVLVSALWMYARSGFGALAGISSNSMVVHTDFDTFWHSAEALWDGRSIYDTGDRPANLNPPFWTLLISPLGLLEPLVAYRVFVLIMVMTSLTSLAWVAGELRLRTGWAVFGVGMLLLSSPLLETLALGQMYPLLALGLVAVWIADRWDRPKVSGVALGLVVAIKPLLAPVALWPLVRRRWGMLGATLASGGAATLVGIIVAGPGTTLDWLGVLASVRLDGTWDNASLPGAAARLFRENDFVEPIATLPWLEPAAYVLGIGIVVFTAFKARRGSEAGLWALVAASLLASPIAWHNYLLLLGPGILLLLARGRVATALLLLALQAIPPQWSEPWRGESTVLAALALTLYFYILVAHWLAFLIHGGEVAEDHAATRADRSVLLE